MSINPKENRDATTNQITDDPKTWSSPKGTGQSDFVRFEIDDLYPERKERLGQYLSDTTFGNSHNPEIFPGGENKFPIAPPDRETVKYTGQGIQNANGKFDESVATVMEKAVEYFNTLSTGTAFDPSVGKDEDGTFGDGHSLLSRKSDIVSEQIDTDFLENGNDSRWASVGKHRFPPNTGEDNSRDLYQVQRSGNNLDQSQSGGTTRFSGFKNLAGSTNSRKDKDNSFWDDYFTRMGLVGAKITLGATGRDLPKTGPDSIRSQMGGAPMGILKQGLINQGDLLGDYAKKDIKLTEAGNTFLDEETQQPTRYEELSKGIKMEKVPVMSNESWGQMNSWNDPFGSTGFPIVENQGVKVAIQILEIWLMVVLRIQVTTALLQIASKTISKAHAGKGAIPWNKNYYHPSPRFQPGTEFFKGSSGFNHPASSKLIEEFNFKVGKVDADQEDIAGALTLGANQLVGPAIKAAIRITENELVNITSLIQRELNIYVPRHILSTMANKTGYNSDDLLGINELIKNIDIFTAYTRAYTAGMASLVVHITAGDMGKSLSFWKTIFRTVVRSKAFHADNIKKDNAYDMLLGFVGKDDKIMRFANYLAMIGDLGTAEGSAGNVAFPENKVPLDRIGNFPTLRTAASRISGGKSRLSLTDTPSLMLVPFGAIATQRQLEQYGVESSSKYGAIEGANTLWRKNKDIDAAIGSKYQSSKENRFTPDQVRMMEDQLEGEHMPFYIQDLRTNEIISFHAFLTSMSDSYSAEWSSQKGFGRMEAAQIYGGGSRAIGISFSIVPMNEADFEEMYVKINKLTTLIYPQWSEGTLMDSGDGTTFIQPFSQVPTASPLCRLRVGDIFTSNYSKVAMARMMGIENAKFSYKGPSDIATPPARDKDGDESVPIKKIADGERYIRWGVFKKELKKKGYSDKKIRELREQYVNDKAQFITSHKISDATNVTGAKPSVEITIQIKKVLFLTEDLKFDVPGGVDAYLSSTWPVSQPATTPTLSLGGSSGGIADLFNPVDIEGKGSNPIMKSFQSTMGRGIAVAVTGLALDWKLNSVPWNLEAGHRAPRQCDVTLSITPIHDITPGLDHRGINRAPIYKVGDKSKSLTGDVWYDSSDYENLINEIDSRTETYLEGGEGNLKDRGDTE